MLHRDAEVVTAVIFGGKHLASVDFHALAVKLAVRVCPGVANPARGLAEAALHEELDTVGPAAA